MAYNEWSLDESKLRDGLLFLVAQYVVGDCDEEDFRRTYINLMARMESAGIETIQWVIS